MLSIIIPVYNVEQYLNQCIDSILCNSDNNVEILLINDGSTDSSGRICEHYLEIDSRIKTFHKKNGGVSSARNLGIEKANGEYLWFIDPDDWISNNAVEIINETLRRQEPELLVFSHIKYLESDKTFKETIAPIEIERTSIENYTSTLGYFRPNVWCYVYKRKMIRHFDISFPAQPYFEDEIFNLDIFAKAESIVQINEQLYFYRERENSAMTKPFSEEKLLCYITLLQAYKCFMENSFTKTYMWKNVFVYIGNMKSGMKKLNYSTKKQKKIIGKTKSIFKNLKFLNDDSRGIIVYKILYNYFPSLFALL